MKFEEAQASYTKALQAVKDAQEHLNNAKELRNKLCPHTETTPNSYHFSGSYYDKAYTDYWDECKCCGFVSNERHETHSWHG